MGRPATEVTGRSGVGGSAIERVQLVGRGDDRAGQLARLSYGQVFTPDRPHVNPPRLDQAHLVDGPVGGELGNRSLHLNVAYNALGAQDDPVRRRSVLPIVNEAGDGRACDVVGCDGHGQDFLRGFRLGDMRGTIDLYNQSGGLYAENFFSSCERRRASADDADAELRRLICDGFDQRIPGEARRGGRAVRAEGLPDPRRAAVGVTLARCHERVTTRGLNAPPTLANTRERERVSAG
jgi:hypothetical protein